MPGGRFGRAGEGEPPATAGLWHRAAGVLRYVGPTDLQFFTRIKLGHILLRPITAQQETDDCLVVEFALILFQSEKKLTLIQ